MAKMSDTLSVNTGCSHPGCMTDRAGTSGTYHAADCQAMFAQRDLRLQFVLSTARLVLNTRLLHPTLQCPADSQTDTLQQNNSRIRKARLGRHTAPGYWSTTAHHATGQPQRTSTATATHMHVMYYIVVPAMPQAIMLESKNC